MKNKGFTLVELLAVIVILTVISLITTPMILGVIETARIGAAKNSTMGYVEAIETAVAMASLENDNYEDKEDYSYDEISVNIKGEMPTGGIYSLKNKMVEVGTFCMNGYEIKYANSQTEVIGKCTGEELKLPGLLKISEASGHYIYPESKTIEVIENISKGELSCETSDEEIAVCKIEDAIITIEPKGKAGEATITIKASSTSKYKEAQAAYLVHTEKGILNYTANDYSGIYDGEEHGITVSCEGATIKYGTIKEICDSDESPKYSKVGEYIVYYEISRAGYQTVTGSRTVTITAPTASQVSYGNTTLQAALDDLYSKLK